jgi:hypothetical protein
MRTDAAGLYALLRQLGCAFGVALLSAVLQAKISEEFGDLSAAGAALPPLPPARVGDEATLRAYADCFTMMAIAALAVMPGILLFRTGRVGRAVKEAVPPGIE